MSLKQLIGLPPSARMIALTGAGGKTSLMYALALESASAGVKTAIMTTTHIGPPTDDRFVIWSSGIEAELEDIWASGRIPVAAAWINGLLRAPGIEAQELLTHCAQTVYTEADGAKRWPVKYPALWEPVLPRYTDEVVVVAGLSALGGEFDEVCYRASLARSRLGITASTLNEHDLAHMIAHGYGRYNPTVVLNQADDDKAVLQAKRVVRHLFEHGINKTYIISLKKMGLTQEE